MFQCHKDSDDDGLDAFLHAVATTLCLIFGMLFLLAGFTGFSQSKELAQYVFAGFFCAIGVVLIITARWIYVLSVQKYS